MKSYGTVRYVEFGNVFEIQCEPHVSLRLKRMFGKLSTHSFNTHRLHASEETARDLEWFMMRYPLEIEDASKQTLVRLCDGHRDTERFIEDFYHGRAEILPLVVLPKSL
jgi:hypothetical protein